MHRSEEFTLGIGPTIVGCTGDVNRTRRDQCNQFVLIDRTSSFVLVVLPVASQNQCGNTRLIRPTVSPIARRLIAAPPQPESLLMTRANRVSLAPAQSDVFPSRECPITATRLASIELSVSK